MIRVWRTETRNIRRQSIIRYQEEGDVKLENLTENALGKANQELICGVMPYDFKDVKKFQLGFLSGFLAEKRDIEKKQIEKKCSRKRVDCRETDGGNKEMVQFRVGKKCQISWA